MFLNMMMDASLEAAALISEYQAGSLQKPRTATAMGKSVMSDERLRWTSASRTHIGRVRKLNEDACLELPEVGLWVVADGMGGHSAGDIASRLIVKSLSGVEPTQDLESLSREVSSILRRVNRTLSKEARRRGKQIIGSTVAALLICGTRCRCLWAGDSRIFLFRDNQLHQLTRDHSQVEEMISQRLISREQAKKHPGSNAITRAIGVMERLDLESVTHHLEANDVFLLCSDGLYNETSTRDIARLLSVNSCQEAVDGLLELALKGRARDNISLIAVRVEDDQTTKTLFDPSAVRLQETEDDDDKTRVNR